MRITLLFSLTLFLGSCGEIAPESQTGVTPVIEELKPTEKLNQWLDSQYEKQLSFSPENRSRLGDKTDYDQLNDYSLAAQRRVLDWQRASVAEMRTDFAYDTLSSDGKLSYDMWEYSLEQAQAAAPFANYGYLFGRGGSHSAVPSFLISYHKVDDASDVQAYLARLRDIDVVFDQLLERAQAAADERIFQPRFGFDSAISEIQRVTAGVPFTASDDSPNSPIWIDIQTKLENLVELQVLDSDSAQSYLTEAREILSGEVMASYQKVLNWLRENRKYAASEPQGVWALPDGENYYNHRLKRMTTVDLSADEIHNIGLDEVARLRSEMELIKNQVGYKSSLGEFFVFMREDSQFYYPNTDEGRQAYLDVNNEYLGFIEQKLPDYFGLLPKADLIVKRVESFREQAGGAQHYRSGSPDGTRPGVFYSHMADMATLAKFQIEDIAYHEGSPGHHMQISIQQELTDIPRFRTQYRTTAYTEGWGLYAEWLAKEMGGFDDPYSDFGRLSGEIWRAVRLVVDTGIHSMRWSEDMAVQYFLDNTPISKGAIRSEVQRYFANPGQATAYKIGMMNFQMARANAEEKLGDKFDIKQFHDVVLGAGAVPIPMMHTRVERWIEESLVQN
ncbi:MAG: hypothetical protein ACJAY7_000560 [Pseudohongiellaceae bacterium]|jgi:uncharacterized protein (DUF885 family)